MGGATSCVGGYLGNTFSNTIGKVTSEITSPILRNVTTQSVTNATVGFTLSTSMALLNGSTFEQALSQGWQGALMGAGIGTMTGTVSGFKYAKDNHVNPWTGRSNLPMVEKISPPSTLLLNTQRIEPKKLSEQLTMQEAQSGRGRPIMEGQIKDPNWKGWQKIQHNHLDLNTNKNITIHYWYNPETRTMSGFKFKN